jgi:hypothetical protein
MNYEGLRTAGALAALRKEAADIPGLRERIEQEAKAGRITGAGLTGIGAASTLGSSMIKGEGALRTAGRIGGKIVGIPAAALGLATLYGVHRYHPAKRQVAEVLQGRKLSPREERELFLRNPSASTVTDVGRSAVKLQGEVSPEMRKQLEYLRDVYKRQHGEVHGKSKEAARYGIRDAYRVGAADRLGNVADRLLPAVERAEGAWLEGARFSVPERVAMHLGEHAPKYLAGAVPVGLLGATGGGVAIGRATNKTEGGKAKEGSWKAPAIGAAAGIPVGGGLGYLTARGEPRGEQIKRTLAGAGIGAGVGALSGVGVGEAVKGVKNIRNIRRAGEAEAKAIEAQTKAVKEQTAADLQKIKAEREDIKEKGRIVVEGLRRGDSPDVIKANLDAWVSKVKKSHDLRVAGRLVALRKQAAVGPSAGQVAKHVLTALGKVPGGARTAFKSMGEQVTRGAAMDPAAPGIIARAMGGTVAAVPALATVGGAAYLAKPHIDPYLQTKLMQYRMRQAQTRPYYDPRVQRYM